MNFKHMTRFNADKFDEQSVLAAAAAQYPEVLREMINRMRVTKESEAQLLLIMQAEKLLPKYAARLRQHTEDEARHTQMLEVLLIEIGGMPKPVDGETFMTEFWCLTGHSAQHLPSLIELLAGLLQIEKRALEMFNLLVKALPNHQVVRPVLEVIRRDEEKHLRWVEDHLTYLASLGPEHSREVELNRRRYELIDQAAFIAMTGSRIDRLKAVLEVADTFTGEVRTQYMLEQVPRVLKGTETIRRRFMALKMMVAMQHQYHDVPLVPAKVSE
ncbi:MAG: ferritin-like domain-containing protein [Acidobacteria bacterium]|nr:ferritin-like domain-containing protein [Acidobacteriota bacterium]